MPVICPQYARKMTLEPFNLQIGEEQKGRYLKQAVSTDDCAVPERRL